MAIGFGIGLIYTDVIDTALEFFLEKVEESGVLQEDGNIALFALLANNWKAMLISAAYGFLPFVFLPVLSLVSNGLLIGVMGALYQSNGMSILVFLAGILPHGIFELPALILSIACGVYLCSNMGRLILGNAKRLHTVPLLCDLLRVMLLLVAPMTVVASVIEVYLTPVILAWFP